MFPCPAGCVFSFGRKSSSSNTRCRPACQLIFISTQRRSTAHLSTLPFGTHTHTYIYMGNVAHALSSFLLFPGSAAGAAALKYEACESVRPASSLESTLCHWQHPQSRPACPPALHLQMWSARSGVCWDENANCLVLLTAQTLLTSKTNEQVAWNILGSTSQLLSLKDGE